MIQSREVRAYFRLRKISEDLARFFWEQDQASWGCSKYDEIKNQNFLDMAVDLDAKADDLFAKDVASAYFYHETKKQSENSKKAAKKRKR